MTDEVDPFEPGFTFIFAWVGLALVVFPLVTTLDAAASGGSLGAATAGGMSVAVTLPAAVGFVRSDRNPRSFATFVVVFVALYAITTLGRASASLALGRAEPIPVIELSVLVATYVVAYGLVYRDWYRWLRQTPGR